MFSYIISTNIEVNVALIYQLSQLYVAKSAGTSDQAIIKLTASLINWADQIFVMEKRHAAIIKQNYPDLIADRSVITLHISDDYQYMDPELIEILGFRLAEYLDSDSTVSDDRDI